jgi:hypothetical protein
VPVTATGPPRPAGAAVGVPEAAGLAAAPEAGAPEAAAPEAAAPEAAAPPPGPAAGEQAASAPAARMIAATRALLPLVVRCSGIGGLLSRRLVPLPSLAARAQGENPKPNSVR